MCCLFYLIKIKSLSITFSKNLAEDERKKLQTLYLELESEEDGVDVDENKVKDAKKKIILDEVVFILFLCYITVTCRQTIVFLRQILLLKHQNVI
jgi:hypothetical protein